jgi:hypothetical protein
MSWPHKVNDRLKSLTPTHCCGVTAVMNCIVTISFLLAGLASGCSQKPSAKFATRLSTADHIVVTNSNRNFGLTLRGEDVAKICKVVTFANKVSSPTASLYDWDVQFFNGTNFLGAIRLMDKEYRDNSRVLSAYYQKWERDRFKRDTSPNN